MTIKLNKIMAVMMMFMGMGFSYHAFADWVMTSNNQCQVHRVHSKPNETATWSGECQDGYVHGDGVLQWYEDDQPKDVYVGHYQQGKMHKKGVYTWAYGGNRYDGEWENDDLHGKGIYTWDNGSYYDGTWKDGNKHGLGKLVLVKDDNMILSWENHGDGEWQGDVYVIQGEFVDGALHLQCKEPTRTACDKARAEETTKKIMENEQACTERYVGEQFYLNHYVFLKGEKQMAYKVVDVGKDKMTIKGVNDGATYQVKCNASKLYK